MKRRARVAEALESRVLLSVSLVADINALPAPAPGPVVAVGDVAYFAHDDSAHGLELWKTDGTPAGTTLVTDLRPGPAGSQPTLLGSAAGRAMFMVDDGAGAQTLYASDGTPGGTVPLHSFSPADHGVTLSNVIPVGAAGFFTVDSPLDKQLWKTDGSPAGTVPVKTFEPFNYPASGPSTLTGIDAGGTLYFGAYTSQTGVELWKSDGTEAGTTLVKDAYPGRDVYPVDDLVYTGGKVFFVKRGLWVTDGSTQGTRELSIPGPYVQIYDLAAFQDQAFVRVRQPVPIPIASADVSLASPVEQEHWELWRSDGTDAGTRLVTDVGSDDYSSPGEMVQSGGSLYYEAELGTQLWRLDSPSATPEQIELQFQDGTPISGLTDVAGTLYFVAPDSLRPDALYRTHGFGAELVASGPASPACVIGDSLLIDKWYGPEGRRTGRELWRASNDSNSATLLTPLVGGTLSSRPVGLSPNGDQLYFDAGPAEEDAPSLWVTSPSGSGATLLKERHGLCGAGTSAVADVNGRHLFWTFDDRTHEEGFWSTDGTVAGTVRLLPGRVETGAVLGDAFYFSRGSGTSAALWRTDGTPAGTTPVTSIPSAAWLYPITTAGDRLFFRASPSLDINTPGNLWTSDGTAEGTRQVTSLSAPRFQVAAPVGRDIYFTVQSYPNAPELWKSDGTAAGTVRVSGQTGGGYAAFAGKLFFWSTGAGGTGALWQSDGTAAGTTKVRDFDSPPGGYYGDNPLRVAGDAFYFAAYDATTGRELWKSDGTAQGTVLVKDVAAGTANASPRILATGGDTVYFSADDAVHGRELWRTDGTAAGTSLVADIQPGREGSDTWEAAVVNGVVYVSAFSQAAGHELWAVRPDVVSRHLFYNNSAYDDPSLGRGNDDAVAPDKRPATPGLDSSDPAFVNSVSNYSRGLNGVMIDVRNLPAASALSADDFDFRVGDALRYRPGPAPQSITVRRGAGIGGSDRVTLTWHDNAIQNQWLRVTLKANNLTGLAAPTAFSFGHLAGDTGNGVVNALDLGAVKRALNTTAGLDSRVDFNRDGRVNALDLGLVRANLNRSLARVDNLPPGAPTVFADGAATVARAWDDEPQGVLS